MSTSLFDISCSLASLQRDGGGEGGGGGGGGGEGGGGGVYVSRDPTSGNPAGMQFV